MLIRNAFIGIFTGKTNLYQGWKLYDITLKKHILCLVLDCQRPCLVIIASGCDISYKENCKEKNLHFTPTLYNLGCKQSQE